MMLKNIFQKSRTNTNEETLGGKKGALTSNNSELSSAPRCKHRDGTAPGFSWTLSVTLTRQSSVKWLLQTEISVQDDSLKRCLLTLAMNVTHSSLSSGSSGKLNSCALWRDESHPATEHISDVPLISSDSYSLFQYI